MKSSFLLVLLTGIMTPLLAQPVTFPPNPIDYPANPNEQALVRPPLFSEANAAAMHFLNIVDNQVFAGAWLESGGLMKDVVSQEIWAAGMLAIRQPLGSVRSRTVASHRSVPSLPGGTQGDFMIITYSTRFSRGRPRGAEVITLMRQPPLGLWKVISYSIGG